MKRRGRGAGGLTMAPGDIELMLWVRGGDLAAFRKQVQRYREPLRRFFVAMLADGSQADDFVPETFLQLWLSRERYQPTGRSSTYMYRIGRHYWLNQRKNYHLERLLECEADTRGLRAPFGRLGAQPLRRRRAGHGEGGDARRSEPATGR